MTYSSKKTPAITIRAGADAIAHIKQHGLQPQDIDIIPGAAGGPKGIALCGLDQAIFNEFLPRAPKKRTFIGSSIGSWRFAAIAAHGGKYGPELLAKRYTDMHFPKGIKPAEVSQRCRHMLAALLEGKQQTLLQHPDMQLVVMLVKCQHAFASDRLLPLGLALTGIYGSNLISRRALKLFMQRCFAYVDAQPEQLPIHATQDFLSQHIGLNQHNVMDVLMASAAIPLIMNAVVDIPQLAKGSYRDGGLIDYHLDLPYNSQGLVLYPHFSDKITPGWFDKSVKWRRANPLNHRRTVLISPSASYLASLPQGRLPDRKDFSSFANNDEQRKKLWQHAIAESQRMGDDFLQLIHSGDVAGHLQPL